MEAWQGAGLAGTDAPGERLAVLEGSSLGPMIAVAELARSNDDALPVSALLRSMPGAGANAVAREIGARGPVHTISAGSVSGAVAVIEGCWQIATGRADVVIAGGADAPLDARIIRLFHDAGILAPDADILPCHPFDTDRNGTVLGEGAGVVVLESALTAARRGAVPLARIVGEGVSGEEASTVAPDPAGRGIARAAALALGRDGPRPSWIKAHGTGTIQNDAAECRGLAGLLEHAPITSLKSMLGHTLGASGAIELVATVLALGERLLPATLGTTTIDPALGHCRVPLQPESATGNTVLLLSQSFGGRTAALAVQRD